MQVQFQKIWQEHNKESSNSISSKEQINGDVLKFSYSNCGPKTDPFQIKQLQVLPDPIKLSGIVNVTADVTLAADVKGPLTVALKMLKKVGPVEVEIPCVDNFGSCTYSDVCQLLPPASDCPAFFKEHSIPCNCPFPMGEYSAQNLDLEIDVPAKIPGGQYTITANMQSKALGHIGCVQLVFNVA